MDGNWVRLETDATICVISTIVSNSLLSHRFATLDVGTTKIPVLVGVVLSLPETRVEDKTTASLLKLALDGFASLTSEFVF